MPSTASTPTRSTSRCTRAGGCRSAPRASTRRLPTVGHRRVRVARLPRPQAHPQAIDPPSGAIVNWNNKPAPGFGAADDNWAYGSVQRVELLQRRGSGEARARRRRAGDERCRDPGPPHATRCRSSRELLAAAPRRARAGRPDARPPPRSGDARRSRLDRDLDGKIDDPGAAVIDAAWPRIADARPAARCSARTTLAAPARSTARLDTARLSPGWYAYVDKDLRTLLGEARAAARSRRVLRRRRPRGVPRVALAGARGRRRRARRGPGPGSRRVALGRHARAHPLRAGSPPGHDARGRTGRRSSRS